HDGVDLIGEQDRPLQGLHPAERASGYRREPLYAELAEKRPLGPDHVRHGDHREVRSVRPAGRRIDRRRPRRPAAAAEQVGGDDEEAIGVERLTGADHPVPPAERLAGRAVAILGREPVAGAFFGGGLRETGRVSVAAERMADQDDVVTPGRQIPVGLVRHPDRVQLPPAVEPDRLGQGGGLCFDRARRAGRERRGWLRHGGYRSLPWSRYCQASWWGIGDMSEGTSIVMTTVTNGVNVQALLDAREVLKGAPEAAQFTWRASAKWQSGVHSTIKVQSFFGLGEEQSHKEEWSFEADHPEVFAAEDNGITPIEYLLVGLASCLTGGIASVAENRGIQLRSVESTVEGGHDIRGILGADSDVRNGYNDIKVTFNIDADASRQEIEALVAQSQKRSAVFDALTNPTNVTVEVA